MGYFRSPAPRISCLRHPLGPEKTFDRKKWQTYYSPGFKRHMNLHFHKNLNGAVWCLSSTDWWESGCESFFFFFFCHGNCSLVAIPLRAAVLPACQLKESQAFLGRIQDKIMGKLWDYERIINEMGPFVKYALTCCRLETEPYQIFQILAFKMHPLYIQLCMWTLIINCHTILGQSMAFTLCYIDQTMRRVLTCLSGRLIILLCAELHMVRFMGQLRKFCFSKA